MTCDSQLPPEQVYSIHLIKSQKLAPTALQRRKRPIIILVVILMYINATERLNPITEWED